MNTTETKLQKLAGEVSEMFEQKERDNGDKFQIVKDGSPKWVTEMCHEAHGDMLPDDYKYDFIVEALDALANYEDPDDIDSEIEADPYTHDRYKWLSSNLARSVYVDEAVENMGHSDQGITGEIGMGQYQEKCEVLGIVRRFLEERLETEGDTETF